MIPLYRISLWALIVAVILFACYLLTKIIVKREMKKSLPPQIQAAKDFFNGRDVRLTFIIKKEGTIEWEHFEIISGIEYAG